MWPYRKIVTQSLTTPLVIARIIFYFALLMLLPLPFMVTSDSFGWQVDVFITSCSRCPLPWC